MPTVLVAGASRGIGLEFVRQYAADGWRVIAACRDPDAADALQPLAGEDRVAIAALDTTDDASVAALHDQVTEPLDLLLVVAGIMGGDRQTLGRIDFAALARTLDTNTAGPLRMAQAFADRLIEGAKLIAISSEMGSIERTTSSAAMPYRISKAALNEAWRCVAIDLKPKGVTAMVLHPGWVATDMGGEQAPVLPRESVAGMRAVIDGLGPDDAGTFRDYRGATLPW